MACKRATTLVLLIGLVLLVLPSSCRGGNHQNITEDRWSMIVENSTMGNQTNISFFQPAQIGLPDGVVGAESLAFDRRGEGPYAGVSDGRVLKWNANAHVWTTFAYNANYSKVPVCNRTSAGDQAANETVCGRPLGLQFHARTGELYIADAYLGLMKVGPKGGEAEVLATGADGVPFNFVNGLDVDQVTGDAFFTDSSATYQRRNNVEILLHRDATGRLLRYNARTKRVSVLKSGLPYPNGVALSGGRTHVLVAHTWPSQVFKYWIRGPKAGQYEHLADLPGYPDNIRRDGEGGYWVALNQEKMNFNATSGTVTPPPPGTPHLVGVRLDKNGSEIAVMTAPRGVTLSDVAARDDGKNKQKKKLWLGSVELSYVGVVDYAPLA